jgi:RHS repeat-associated protein
MECNQKGRVTARYVHGLGIDEPLAVENARDAYYYHADGLGSIVGLTNERGRVVQRYDYDSFGNMQPQWHPVKQPYTYTGREYDPETGLYYYRARYYDPKIGRFITRDPIGFASRDVNLYAYAHNNPMNFRDPSGLRECENEDPQCMGLCRAKYFIFCSILCEPLLQFPPFWFGCNILCFGASELQCQSECKRR